MAASFLTTFQIAFSWINKFRLRFHWSVFTMVRLTKFQHWFGAVQAASHYLNQRLLVHWSIYASFGLNELNCPDNHRDKHKDTNTQSENAIAGGKYRYFIHKITPGNKPVHCMIFYEITLGSCDTFGPIEVGNNEKLSILENWYTYIRFPGYGIKFARQS